MLSKEFVSSILAGFIIGIGDIIYLMSENKVVGAFLFSLGLLSIIYLKLDLFTGKIGYFSFDKGLVYYVAILIGNFIGISLSMLLSFAAWGGEGAMTIATNVFSKPWYILFLSAVGCGILMYLGVTLKFGNIGVIMCIMVFILSGFEHCIARFPYLLLNFSVVNLGKFLWIIAGNSFGAIVFHNIYKWCKGENL